MRRRENLVEQFSTFLFWGDENVRWVSDGGLQRRMESYLAQDESLTNPEYWVLFFQQKWLSSGKEDNPFRQHLHAYLQEPCYWAAHEMYENYQERFEYAKEDYFQTGVELFDKEILSKFNPQLNTRFYNFALTRLKQRIGQRLRERDKTAARTIWSLLLECSEKRLRDSLKGLPKESIENHLLAWDYYKEIYGQAQEPKEETWKKITNQYNSDPKSTDKVDPQQIKEWIERIRTYQCSDKDIREKLLKNLPKETVENHLLAWDYYKKNQARKKVDGKLQPPSPEQWAEIAKKYNSDPESTPKVSPQEIKQWLNTCGNALLNYLNPTRKAIELDKPIREDGENTIGAVTEDPTQGNPIDILAQQEEWESAQQNMKKILDFLKEEIPKIKTERQSEMEMRYGEKLTWQDIAVSLGKERKDYTPILRRIQTVRKNLAKKFIEWAKNNLHTPLKSNDIETMSEALELWLEYYYQNTNNH